MHQFSFETVSAPESDDLGTRAALFCDAAPHRTGQYARRNWGGPLHSLCSYQGKLKPSIAHFLVSWFTSPGQSVLDPLAGVGTIPLEARRQGRIGIASDLSPLADAVCRAKLEPFAEADVWKAVSGLEQFLGKDAPDVDCRDAEFGLNGSIREYFHERTLREVMLARHYFLADICGAPRAARDVLKSSLLHILHGNRPYALSRRSHPVTPFAPTGPITYRPLVPALRTRLQRILPYLLQLKALGPGGAAYLSDFRSLNLPRSVDAVITSPPFSASLRFWSSNWMRLWFAGWSPSDFRQEPINFLEMEQRTSFAAYSELAEALGRLITPGGLLIMHLGETTKINMAAAIKPMLEPHFEICFTGRESVTDGESHGLTDKGATVAHWYLFARSRGDA
jgi:hypothetical protein